MTSAIRHRPRKPSCPALLSGPRLSSSLRRQGMKPRRILSLTLDHLSGESQIQSWLRVGAQGRTMAVRG